MKKVSLVLVSLFALAASAQAGQFKCAESSAAAEAKGRAQYAVFLKTVERITDPRVVGEYDFAERVRVSVLSREPGRSGAKFELDRPTFTAVAKSEDVMYNINARRAHGFEMGIYMDELDQTWVKLKGVRGTIQMNCSYKD